ncbi:hypothetical protein SNOG_05002 [Parastagonospora nodorum SN15]|uniref:C2H2-type domain-containing protein n=1 Tax=Phaeosphaeria nodorum (strain SN15 / ATCC MYA-4574 / FGSC 10173) TaxID=321614 RepID=Q0UTB2_PHANO|nr:hypothetical protein SNOG_05002 [Parastagonospora nodorum SN15]EAT87393.2 hypothetical protein SNOG_05002 [Parastagonospora nodorum SN15]
MDIQRGRSPSAGSHANNIRSSPSPHAFPNNLSPYDPSIHPTSSFPATSSGFDSNQFLASTQPQQFAQQGLDQSFLQANPSLSQHNTPQFRPQGNDLQPDHLNIANTSSPDFNSFFAGSDLNQNNALNPTYLGSTLDPQLLESQQQQNQSINPNDLMNQMAATQSHTPTPPHLLPTMNNHQNPSPHASPNMNQGAFPSPGHSRHASLDPSAARAPSETYSDVSSAHASPYLTQQDSFEENQPSPLLHAQNDPQLFQDPVMQFGQFTLNDGTSHISPGHSPHLSPRLIPQQQQQALPQFQPGSFGLDPNMNNQFGQQGMGVYPNSGAEPFPSLNQGIPEFGQADAMSPPEINIDFAPPSRQASFEPPKPEHQADALSPPDRSDGSNPKRTQKHPATFQCSLCPKRFTRAYNLRSHLRTHTDERPFVCSVCGKAFARQHDRKRHEGLHSGEKKFVCRGNLKDGNHWGCGRRFARADALGRHFRSEAGRVCIRPLLEEEAQEKGGWDGQQQMANGTGMFQQMPAQNYGPGMMSQSGFEPFPQAGMSQAPAQFLPAALLAQYPALAGIQWDQLPPGNPEEMEGDISGRSSFDASSGGEYFEDESDYQGQQPVYAGNEGGWASDQGYH